MSHAKRNVYLAGFGVALLAVAGISSCSGGPLTTREKAAAIGTVGGAAAGGLVGAAVGHAATGALVGSALGLGSGALIGDQLQGHEKTEAAQQRQIQQNRAELYRQRQEIQRLERLDNEY